MIFRKFTFFVLLMIVPSFTARIPFIRDAVFIPLSRSHSITITNYTCAQCLCMKSSSQLLLNCFPNNTCQFFSNFSRKYQIQQVNNATLYFLQTIFPNASRCCMPNLTDLLYKVRTASPTYTTRLFSPRCLLIDNHGYLVTISRTNSTIARFNATDMTPIDVTPGLFTNAFTIQYYDGHYYVGTADRIVVIDSTTLTVQNNITSINLDSTRDMIFLNHGNTLVVASTLNKRLLFFNRSNNFSTRYDYQYQQLVDYLNPHGLFFINDSFFYTTSWSNNTVWSYTATENSTQWKENLFINVTPALPTGSGNHITVDDCGRWWFSLYSYGLQIFNEQGILIGRMNVTNSAIFDTLITDNYVFYLSDGLSHRIIRIDPGIQC